MKIVIELYKIEKVMMNPSFLELAIDKDKKSYEVEDFVLKSRESVETSTFIFNEEGIIFRDIVESFRKYCDLKSLGYDSIKIYEDGELILDKEL